jgi:hypothetical protein
MGLIEMLFCAHEGNAAHMYRPRFSHSGTTAHVLHHPASHNFPSGIRQLNLSDPRLNPARFGSSVIVNVNFPVPESSPCTVIPWAQ